MFKRVERRPVLYFQLARSCQSVSQNLKMYFLPSYCSNGTYRVSVEDA